MEPTRDATEQAGDLDSADMALFNRVECARREGYRVAVRVVREMCNVACWLRLATAAY